MNREINIEKHENVILNNIKNKKYKRNDIAKKYFVLLYINHSCHKSRDVNFKKIGDAIIERWSVHALDYIIKNAWKM